MFKHSKPLPIITLLLSGEISLDLQKGSSSFPSTSQQHMLCRTTSQFCFGEKLHCRETCTEYSLAKELLDAKQAEPILK